MYNYFFMSDRCIKNTCIFIFLKLIFCKSNPRWIIIMVNCIWKMRKRKTRKGKLEGRAIKETKKKRNKKEKRRKISRLCIGEKIRSYLHEWGLLRLRWWSAIWWVTNVFLAGHTSKGINWLVCHEVQTNGINDTDDQYKLISLPRGGD